MAESQHLMIPWSAWVEDTQFELALTDTLRTEMLAPADILGWERKQIQRALANPIGSSPIRELARYGQTACIAVDDLARPTRAADLLPDVMAELADAGISAEQCTIVVATGTHGSLTTPQIEQKIGREIMYGGAKIAVHCPEQLCAAGIQYGSDDLLINRAFLKADFKLGISCVLPHAFAGYSGGAKMMLPGLANIEATARAHKFVQLGLRGGSDVNHNQFRREIEDLARQLGFNFTICVVTNRARETAGVYAGDLVQAHRAACEVADQRYCTPCAGAFDALIVNSYPKDMELVQAESSLIAFKQTGFGIVRESGVIVICTAAKKLGEHGLFAPGGASYRRPGPNRALGNRELWIFAPCLTEDLVRLIYWQGYHYFSDMAALNQALCQRLGPEGRVGILPAAPMQQLVLDHVGISR